MDYMVVGTCVECVHAYCSEELWSYFSMTCLCHSTTTLRILIRLFRKCMSSGRENIISDVKYLSDNDNLLMVILQGIVWIMLLQFSIHINLCSSSLSMY